MYILDYRIDKRLVKLKDKLKDGYLNYMSCFDINLTKNRVGKIDKVVSCFVLNSYYVNLQGRTQFGVTLDQTSYSTPTIVNGRDTKIKISYTYMRSFFDYLVVKGFINLRVGGVSEYGIVKGKWGVVEKDNSFVTIKDKLSELYNSFDNINIEKKVLENIIIVKDPSTGKPTTFKVTKDIKLVMELLNRSNKVSINCEVRSEVGLHDVQLHKVYIGKTFNRNARSYMSGSGIQVLSKEQRKNLIINDNETVVYDYSAFEPSIAYSLCGKCMPPDPYAIELDGYDKSVLRDIAKRCLLVMLNIKDKSIDSLRAACNGVINKEFKLKGLLEEGKVPERIDVITICELLDTKNYMIRDFFYGNAKVDTCYIGSLICDYITDYFSQRGVLVLSVFDEFIIEEEYEGELVKVMHNAFSFICDNETNCKITKEK